MVKRQQSHVRMRQDEGRHQRFNFTMDSVVRNDRNEKVEKEEIEWRMFAPGRAGFAIGKVYGKASEALL